MLNPSRQRLTTDSSLAVAVRITTWEEMASFPNFQAQKVVSWPSFQTINFGASYCCNNEALP